MRGRIKIIALVCASVMLLPLPVFAQVETTKEPTAGSSVYIAGNPDMYPIEYYDEKSDSYRGILPELYGEISERTGIGFSYIRAGNTNEQERLADNKQAEIISAHIKGQVDAPIDEYTVLSYDENGEKVEVCIGFTDISSDELVSAVKAYLDATTESRLIGLFVSETAQKQPARVNLLLLIAVILLAFAATILLAVIIRGRIKAKKKQRNRLIDPLTGIGNDKYFRHCYENYISSASYSLYFVAYFAVEMKRIEKYLAEAEKEEIERHAANVLSAGAAETDFSARITDGVFALSFLCPTEEQAARRTEELLDKLNSCEDRFFAEYKVLFRAGVFHLDTANIPCETALLNASKGYNYAVKNKLPYYFSDEKILKHNALEARLQKKLSDAVNNNEFKLYMQFIINAKTGKIYGAECLSRWQNAAEGLIMPSHYIESMKTAGLIDRLDFHNLEECCSQLERWQNSDKSELCLFCNFTRITVSSADFMKKFREITSRFSFDHRKLVIELTEDSLSDNKTQAFQNVLDCKKGGFRVALDDFGSGYSSFSDLCDYPIDIIKIDHHIIAKTATARGKSLLQGIIKLAHDLGIEVLCEGVETENENRNSKAAGCDYIQGYYYSRAFPQEEAPKFYHKFNNQTQ